MPVKLIDFVIVPVAEMVGDMEIVRDFVGVSDFDSVTVDVMEIVGRLDPVLLMVGEIDAVTEIVGEFDDVVLIVGELLGVTEIVGVGDCGSWKAYNRAFELPTYSVPSAPRDGVHTVLLIKYVHNGKPVLPLNA